MVRVLWSKEVYMLHPDFKNGEKLDLQSAMAVFVTMMGLLFYIDAAPGTHTVISLLTLLTGVIWFCGRHWHLTHSH